MSNLEVSIAIDRPLDEVFAVLSNVENYPKWYTGFLEAHKTSQGPIGVGTTWRVVQKAIGREIEGEVEVTQYEPNRELTQKSRSGPFPVQIRQTFEPVNGGTRVTIDFESEPGGFFELGEPVVATMGQRAIETGLANLKDLMEAHAL